MLENTDQKNPEYGNFHAVYLKDTVSARFTFTLAFTMPLVSGSDLHKNEDWLQKVKV